MEEEKLGGDKTNSLHPSVIQANEKYTDSFALSGYIKLIQKELNSRKAFTNRSVYTKEAVLGYLANPYTNEQNLVNAVRYIYSISTHFRRLIRYLSSLTDLSYVIAPHNINITNGRLKDETITSKYRKVQDAMDLFSPRTSFPRIIRTCLVEDVFYGTIWTSKNDISIQKLPPERCTISSVEGNVCNVAFDFSYFSSNERLLDFYPDEFRTKYNYYKKNTSQGSWIELDSPDSFAIKFNNETLDHIMPPFAGLLGEIYDIQDTKRLKLSKAEIDNYAMVAMTLPMTDDGMWGIDLDKAREFFGNLYNVLPEEVGSVLTPMKLDVLNFDNKAPGERDSVQEAEQHLFTAAGVSSLLFNNEKASANALALSIKVDQAITYELVKSIEDVINRYIRSQTYGKNWKVTFLDTSPFNRKEVSDGYLKGAQYGMPLLSHYCASIGLTQADMENINYLEIDLLNIKDKLIPLKSSSTMSSKDIDESKAGRPEKDAEDLTESGEQNREDA